MAPTSSLHCKDSIRDRFLKLPTWIQLDQYQDAYYELSKRPTAKEREAAVKGPGSVTQHSTYAQFLCYEMHHATMQSSASRSSTMGFSSSPYTLPQQQSQSLSRLPTAGQETHAVHGDAEDAINPLSHATQRLLRPQRLVRHIPTSPFKVLDAPGLIDDFYLNLVDWSTSNLLSVGLSKDLYLWNAANASTLLFKSLPAESNDMWTSMAWMADGQHLALGTRSGRIEVWNVKSKALIHVMKSAHRSRVGTLHWNQSMLSSGSKDHCIHHHDMRMPYQSLDQADSRQHGNALSSFTAHRQEICGLKWDGTGKYLASGGNDNLVCVWDARVGRAAHLTLSEPQPLYCWSDHEAAVKAIDWCPSKSNWLATGGGTLDRKLILWDVSLGSSISRIDTGSQICNMTWSRNQGDLELVTSHGFTQNQLILWKVDPLFAGGEHLLQTPSLFRSTLRAQSKFSSHNKRLTPLLHLVGHGQRVIHMARNPNGSSIVTGSGDETLRFWNVFDAKGKPFSSPAMDHDVAAEAMEGVETEGMAKPDMVPRPQFLAQEERLLPTNINQPMPNHLTSPYPSCWNPLLR